MCDICHMSQCPSGCPNAPEPKAVYTCEHCGEAIVEGDEFVELDGCYYHEECFGDAAESILLEKYGAVRGVAEEDDGYDG